MTIFIGERLWPVNDNTFLSLQIRRYGERFGRTASRAFKSGTPEIPEADFDKIKGSNPRMAGIKAVPS